MHNHEFAKECHKRMRNTLTGFQREKIKAATRYGFKMINYRILNELNQMNSLQLFLVKETIRN